MERKKMTLLRSYRDAAKMLAASSKEDACDYLLAVLDYGFDDIQPEISGAAGAMFLLTRPNLDTSLKMADGGKNGGAQSKPAESLAETCTKPNASPAEAQTKPAESLTEPEIGVRSKEIGDRSIGVKDNPPLPPKGGERAPAKQARKPRGAYGWVKLTDDEFNRLLNDFGEAEVERCIAYVDESAQSTGNKNKWRDWNLVVRKCHRDGWGLAKSANTRGGYTSGVDRLAEMYREEFG